MLLGIDLDNTLVCYDHVFADVARRRGWLEPDSQGKKHIRDSLRLRPDGEKLWTALQAIVYGPEMHRAEFMPGARDFLLRCRAQGIPMAVISHKTRYAADRSELVDLRQAAKAWLIQSGFFDPAGIGLPEDMVFFEDDRAAKVDRIASVGCTHFIDDLEEVLAAPNFPVDVQRILYAPKGGDNQDARWHSCQSWDEIGARIFGHG